LRANLEDMATESQKDSLQDSVENQGPMDAELFAGQVYEELSDSDIFAGDEDFQLFLAGQARAQTAAKRTRRIEPAPGQLPDVQTHHRNFSTLQKVLAVSIIIIAAILVFTLLKSHLLPVTNRHIPPVAQQTPPAKPAVEVPKQPRPEQIQKPEPAPKPTPKPTLTQPLSLKVAQDLYLQADYKKAYAVYNQLNQSLPAGAEEELLNDFLKLRMALCMRGIRNTQNATAKSGKADGSDRAYHLFRTLLQSRSPVVKMLANYYLSFIELEQEQYLKARGKAYQTLALVDAVDFDNTWAVSLRPDCHFLIAESMTRYILSLYDADKDLPGQLWSTVVEADPFSSLNESQLRSLLSSGSEQLNKSLLGPQIQRLENEDTSWSVVCCGAPIDELLVRFAANSGLNITWHLSNAKGHPFRETAVPEVGKEAARHKPACLFLPEVTTLQFLRIAAGHIGLLARLDNEGVVNIFNPADYRSLSEHKEMITQEAVSLWQRFLSVFHSDQRIPNAHFAIGLLKAQTDYVAEAIAEYKLVANRYAQSSLAPFALSHSSKLKAALRDYNGARQDLTQLVEQYPENELSGLACLNLADATMKAGLSNEAGRLYSKVYHLGLSLDSQIDSAFGAGRCFYEQKDYEAAAKWMTRHIELGKMRKSKKLYSSCLLLGKSNLAMGQTQQACDAFEAALSGPAELLSGREYAEALSSLAEAKIQQVEFIEALAILENTRDWRLSAEESMKLLLLKSRVLRDMGLVNEAVAAIGDRAQYTLDPQAKASISLELAKCYSAKGSLQQARRELSEILIIVEPGTLAHEIALELADVCLKLGHSSQTISVCSQLLDLRPTEAMKQKALNILAAAYTQRKDYDRAALALLGRWNVANAEKEKTTSDKPIPSDQSLPAGK
jgi:tetratricopeptide (TPR) repeat protein